MPRVIVTGSDQQRDYELRPLNTIGRHPDNTLQILDRIVSKEHAQIHRASPTVVSCFAICAQPERHVLSRRAAEPTTC